MMDAAVTTAIRGKSMDAAKEEMGKAIAAPHEFAPAEFK
jgi:molecular chaperone DnaK